MLNSPYHRGATMKPTRILLSVSIIAALSLTQLHAKNRQQGACKAEIEKLCGSHKGNRPAMKACIQQNKDKVSAECKAGRDRSNARNSERKVKNAKALETCAPDLQKFCPETTKPGAKKQAPYKCLMQNREQVSATCKAALPGKRTE